MFTIRSKFTDKKYLVDARWEQLSARKNHQASYDQLTLRSPQTHVPKLTQSEITHNSLTEVCLEEDESYARKSNPSIPAQDSLQFKVLHNLAFQAFNRNSQNNSERLCTPLYAYIRLTPKY